MKNTLIYLTGFPASGKLTIAKMLCQETDAYLVDNHTINNPVFQVVRKTGSERLHESIWDRTAMIRDIVLDTIVEIGASDASFVMTNVLVDTPGDRKLFDKIQHTAKRRNALFVPVKLNCDENSMLERVSNADRSEKLKLTDHHKLKLMFEQYKTLPFTHEKTLEVDTGMTEPAESVARIIRHVEHLVEA